MNMNRRQNLSFIAVSLLGAFFTQPSWAQTIETMVFPSGRAVQEGNLAAAFLTLNNTGTVDALGCKVEPINSVPATFLFAQIDPLTSVIIGPTNGPFTIPAGSSVKLNVTFITHVSFSPIEVLFNVICTPPIPPPNSTGQNTLLLSASSTPVADIVALTSAPSGTATLSSPNATDAFLIASLNLGASDLVTMSADTGSPSLSLNLLVCEFDVSIGNCLLRPRETTTQTINTGEVTFYAVFIGGQGTPIPLNPTTNRVFARFRDSSNVVRGLTSVAVQVEGSTVPDGKGTYTGSITIISTNCLNELDNATETVPITISIPSQSNSTFSGSGSLMHNSSVGPLTTTLTISGTVIVGGNVNATFTFVSRETSDNSFDSSGNGSLNGTLIGNTLSTTFNSQATA